MSEGALYFGRVAHARLRPVAHHFSYRVFSMLLDLDRLDALDKRLKLFSRGRFNLFSFYDRDHGCDQPDDLARYVRGVLLEHGLPADGPIRLLCYPRILGYQFNPLAVYYCHDRADRLCAVLYEVNNTFGGRHSYLIPIEEDGEIVRHDADKMFHVSPFMAMDTRYHFRLSQPAETAALAIRQSDRDGVLFNAVFTGARADLTDSGLLRAFFAYPLMTLKVIAGIHYEALRLFLKGVKLVKAAPDPPRAVTFVAPKRKGPAKAA